MKAIAMPVGLIALIGTIAPPALFFAGFLEEDLMKNIMLISCLVWFVTAPMWIRAAE